MTSEQFVFWLQGFFEISEAKELSEKQVEIVKNHLKLVFYHEIDPSYSSDPKVQEEMQMIHDGRTNITGELITDRPSRPLGKPEQPEDRVLIEGKRLRQIPQTLSSMRAGNFNNRGRVKCLNMNPREYCIWLQGYLEAAGNNLSEAQVETIKNRLNNIFDHVAEQPQTQEVKPTKPPVDPSQVLYRC